MRICSLSMKQIARNMSARNSSKFFVLYLLPATCVHLCIKRRLAVQQMTVFDDVSLNQNFLIDIYLKLLNQQFIIDSELYMPRNCGLLSEHACRSAAIASIHNILIIILLGLHVPQRKENNIVCPMLADELCFNFTTYLSQPFFNSLANAFNSKSGSIEE